MDSKTLKWSVIKGKVSDKINILGIYSNEPQSVSVLVQELDKPTENKLQVYSYDFSSQNLISKKLYIAIKSFQSKFFVRPMGELIEIDLVGRSITTYSLLKSSGEIKADKVYSLSTLESNITQDQIIYYDFYSFEDVKEGN